MSTEQRLALLVLGMHRSGTSAFAGLLSLCGATLPQNLIPANPRNPKGFFESEPLYQLHDELFADAETAWHDLSPFPERFLASRQASAWEERIRDTVVSEFGDSAFFVLKDPRLCRLVPFWQRVLQGLAVEPRFVLPVRDPLEIARSLRGSADLAEASGLMLWLDYFLAAERDSRGSPRCFVSYPALLQDWRPVLARIERTLDLDFPRHSRTSDAEIDAFLNREHRHEVTEAEEIFAREDVHPWVKRAYRWALDAAHAEEGDAPPSDELDAIGEELRYAESAFGPALAASEVQRREQVADAERAREKIDTLEGQLEEHQEEMRELRAKLAEKREEASEFTSTVRMLMRWVVDRARSPEEPVPPALKAAIDTIGKSEPAEIPGIASTALLLSEQELVIRELTAERNRRAGTLDELATKLAQSELQRGGLAREVAARDAALARTSQEDARLRAAITRARRGEREQRAAAASATRERERLVQECARLLRGEAGE